MRKDVLLRDLTQKQTQSPPCVIDLVAGANIKQ